MIKPLTATSFVCAFLATGLGLSAVAQAPENVPQKSQSRSTHDPAPPQNQAPEPEPQEEPSLPLTPVLWVSSVEVIRSGHGPALDIIRVRGLSSTEGWQNAELVPLGSGVSPDGMLDLAFVAQPPSTSSAPGSFPVLEAIFTIEPGHPYKGVRVHGATNRVTLKGLPGYAEAPNPPNDCEKCVGKLLVSKGDTVPSGTNSTDLIREENLPKMLHVVKANDGIGTLNSDPNRLTLVLGEDGRIEIAIWD